MHLYSDGDIICIKVLCTLHQQWGCLDSQLTPPRTLGLPQIAGICLRCHPSPHLKPPTQAPPRISGRYISPLTAMAFPSSYLVRIPGESHGKSGERNSFGQRSMATAKSLVRLFSQNYFAKQSFCVLRSNF